MNSLAFRLGLGGLTLCAALAMGPAAFAQKPDGANVADKGVQYLRIVENKGKSIALEIAAHDYVRADGSGPRVALVGVAHIADRSFYRSVEKLLKQHDVVLYESVKPPGTGGAGGETDEERIKSTEAAMEFIAGLLEEYRAANDQYPADWEALQQYVGKKDPRVIGFLKTALIDAWGNRLNYTVVTGEKTEGEETIKSQELFVMSYGADGKIGGECADADLRVSAEQADDPAALSKDDGLQSQLAEALGLEFQLDSLPYDGENWRCSDMAMDEVQRRLTAKGLDFNMLGGTLAGSSLPAKLIKFFLGFVKMADTFMEGAITDTIKVVMIEVLGTPELIEQGLSQFGDGFGEVIINDRNQVVIDDLKQLIEREPQVKSVAILYGAGHMPDLAARLAEQLEYEPKPRETTWMAAMTVDLTQSKVPAADMERLRMMMKQALRQQLRRR